MPGGRPPLRERTPTPLGDLLRSEITRRGISDREAASLLQTTPQTLSRWISGRSVSPGARACMRIGAFLGIKSGRVVALLPDEEAADPDDTDTDPSPLAA